VNLFSVKFERFFLEIEREKEREREREREREIERDRERDGFFSQEFVFFVHVSLCYIKSCFFSRKTKMKRKAMLVVLFITVFQMTIECSAEGNIDFFL
jgi:hypothetical protein